MGKDGGMKKEQKLLLKYLVENVMELRTSRAGSRRGREDDSEAEETTPLCRGFDVG